MEKVVIGKATLYCGDCLEVMPLLTDSVDMIAADLPYGTTAFALGIQLFHLNLSGKSISGFAKVLLC